MNFFYDIYWTFDTSGINFISMSMQDTRTLYYSYNLFILFFFIYSFCKHFKALAALSTIKFRIESCTAGNGKKDNLYLCNWKYLKHFERSALEYEFKNSGFLSSILTLLSYMYKVMAIIGVIYEHVNMLKKLRNLD